MQRGLGAARDNNALVPTAKEGLGGVEVGAAPAPEAAPAGDAEEALGDGFGGQPAPLNAVAFPLVVFLLGQLFLFTGVGALIPALPLYGKALGLGDTVTGVVISAPALAMLLLNYVAGRSADAGRKPSIVSGLLGIAVADFVTATATTLPVIVVARLALGAGRAFAEAGERAFLTDLAAQVPGNRGRIVGMYQATIAVGFVIGPKLGGVLIERYGPGAPFGAVALASGLAAVGYAFLLPETLVDAPSSTAQAITSGSSPGSWRRLLRQPSQRAIAAASVANGVGRVAKVVAVPLFATDVIGASPGQLGDLFSLWALVGLIAVTGSGYMTDKLKLSSADPAAGARLVVCASQVASALGFVVAVRTHSLWAFGVSTGFWSLGFGAAAPALETYTQARAPPAAVAEALALPKSLGDLVFIVGPPAIGFAESTVHGGGLLISACVSLLASAVWWSSTRA